MPTALHTGGPVDDLVEALSDVWDHFGLARAPRLVGSSEEMYQ